MTRVTAAVVSYNTRELLAACLESMAGDDRLEVWVVDNASTDGSAEMVRERFPWVRLEARTDNLGFGAAVNLVARASSGWDWLAVANADTALMPGALDALLAAGDRDPQAGAVAPRLILPDGSTQHSVHPFWSPSFALRFSLGRQRRDRAWADEQCLEGFWDPERPRRVPWALGAFLLVRRAAWEAAGGFDAGQWLYAEDLDLGWRLHRAGLPTRYVPEALVRHQESASIAPVWGDARTDRWMAASYDWMLRHRGPVRTLATAAIFSAASALRWRGRGDRSAERRWAELHTLGLRRAEMRRRMPRPPTPQSPSGRRSDPSATGPPGSG